MSILCVICYFYLFLFAIFRVHSVCGAIVYYRKEMPEQVKERWVRNEIRSIIDLVAKNSLYNVKRCFSKEQRSIE
jgi:hypothetical protein